MAVKSIAQVVELSTAHARKQFDALSVQTKELTVIAQKTAVDASEPVKAAQQGVQSGHLNSKLFWPASVGPRCVTLKPSRSFSFSVYSTNTSRAIMNSYRVPASSSYNNASRRGRHLNGVGLEPDAIRRKP